MTTVVPVDHANRRRAAATLAAAFATDPLFRWPARGRSDLVARLVHGYTTTGSIAVPRGAPPVTAMWRDPR